MAGYVETILPFSEKTGGSGIKKPLPCYAIFDFEREKFILLVEQR